MTPERIEELAGQCEASPVKRKAIVDALRQCAQEAANEALERAAKVCESARLDWAKRFPNGSATAYDAGRTTALLNAEEACRSLKGKP